MAYGEDYEKFVEKFKPKKTTDDCYTPPEIYEVIKDYACKRYEVDSERVIRPFYPGGDYRNFKYENAVVIDNPPFSILAEIYAWYIEKNVPFFLFAPSLTLFSGSAIFDKINHIVCNCTIEYENGARVKTSFLTNLETDGTVVEVNHELTKLVNNKVKELRKEKTKRLPKYDYPAYVTTAALLQKLANYDVDFKIKKGEYKFIRSLDSQKKTGKSIFGAGLLLSEKAAAEKAAAEKAAAEKATAEKANVQIWELSEREWEIIKSMRKEKTNK